MSLSPRNAKSPGYYRTSSHRSARDPSKGGGGTFAATHDNVEEAKARAARRLVEARRAGVENPTTHVHVLVERLQTLRG